MNKSEREKLRGLIDKAIGELVNLQPHIAQLPSGAGFIDPHVDEAMKALAEARTALPLLLDALDEVDNATCEWDEDDGLWHPGCCGETWELTEGTLTENGVAHCMYCGARVIVVALEKED